MARTLHMDYETASEVDIKSAGAHVYAEHPSTHILMLGWAMDDDPVELWEPHLQPGVPAPLLEALLDDTVICEAANAQFERLITKYCLGIEIPYHRWRCTLVKGYYLGFAGGLDNILEQVGLQSKDPRGKRLINKFCGPAPKNHKVDWYTWENSPDDWTAFGEYCRQDVVVERELGKWLAQFPQMLDWDWHQYFVDQYVNDRGVPLDVTFAQRAIDIWYQERDRLNDILCQKMGTTKATRAVFLDFINMLETEPFHSLNGDYVTSRRLRGDLQPFTVELLDLYSMKEGKAATKYNAVLKCVSTDGRARGMFQYKGASRTDRVGGRRLQLQNLKRPVVKTQEQIEPFVQTIMSGNVEQLQSEYKVSLSEALGGAVRHVIKAPEGKSLAVADLTSIESVVLGWLTNCQLINDTFTSGRDSYRVFGTQYYGIEYDQVTKEQRTFCKPPVLGCGYMLGWVGLIAYAEGMGVNMGEDDARRAVDTFRSMYPEIPAFWKWLYDAIKHTTTTGHPSYGYRLTIERDAKFIRIRLPSGRSLSYFEPKILPHPAPWDPTKTIMNFTYLGMNDKRQWVRISAHAGGVTENIIQSVASDVLWGGIDNATREGLDVILHVHDEIAVESWDQNAERDLDHLINIMTRKPSWAPDLWLGADGFITKRYTKD